AIEFKAIGERHQRDDVFLETNVGTAPASTSPTTATATTTAADMSSAASAAARPNFHSVS
ncbi:MAG: hypothetical protein WBE50_02065, partial [Methyloceanibacter sp.]